MEVNNDLKKNRKEKTVIVEKKYKITKNLYLWDR